MKKVSLVLFVALILSGLVGKAQSPAGNTKGENSAVGCVVITYTKACTNGGYRLIIKNMCGFSVDVNSSLARENGKYDCYLSSNLAPGSTTDGAYTCGMGHYIVQVRQSGSNYKFEKYNCK